MKAIFIRGVPGTGKTIVAEQIKKRLSNSEIINVDNLKIKAMHNGKDFESAKNIAYEQSLKKLYKFYLIKKNYVILDELICEEEFLKKLHVFLDQTNSHSYWFRLVRKLKELLEVESKRDRQIKNNLDDFNKLKQDIESLKIKNEYLIKNDDLALTIKKILDVVV